MKKRAYRVFVLFFTFIFIFCIAVCPLSYARVVDVSNDFKYVAASTFDGTGEIRLTAGEFDYATNASNAVHFQTYLTQQVNIVSFRMSLGNIFNTAVNNWFAVVPTMGTTNITNYTFYIVPDGYSGEITTSIDPSEYVYKCTYTYYGGVLNLVSEDYGGKFAGRAYMAPDDGSSSVIPSNCDLIVSTYSSTPRSGFVVNFVPLTVGQGQGARPDINSVKPGENTIPVPDNWYDQLHGNDDLYEQVDIKLSNIMDFITNPATLLNHAMNQTRYSFNRKETHYALRVVDRLLGIPFINMLAWALALFGSVFSLFNLAISFVPTGQGGGHSQKRVGIKSSKVQRQHLTQGEWRKGR